MEVAEPSKIGGGYILHARKQLASDMMDKPPLWFKLWDWMLMKAAWKDHNNLKRGQFFTTLKEMQKEMSWKVGFRTVSPTIKEIRAAHEGFMKLHMTGATKVMGGMLITICNYDLYQNPDNYEGHNEGRSQGTSRAQQNRRREEEETIEEEINPSSSCDELPPEKKKPKALKKVMTEGDEAMAYHILAAIKRVVPGFKEPVILDWGNTIRLMRERDNRTLDEIGAVFDWANRDNFWQTNILSPGKLRKQFDNLKAKMGSRPGGGGGGGGSLRDRFKHKLK